MRTIENQHSVAQGARSPEPGPPTAAGSTTPLGARLALLGQQSGARTLSAGLSSAATRDDAHALIERLRLAQRVRESARLSAQSALPGQVLERGVRVISAAYPLPAWVQWPAHVHAPWLPAPEATAVPCASDDLVFLDTETTGLSGGTGTLIFVLAMARVRAGVVEVTQWLLTEPGAEHAWLAAIVAALSTRSHLVSYNGKTFDLPLLSARQRLMRRSDAFADLPHWDLLTPMRRAFRGRWPNCRLQTAEQRLLGIARVEDLPGSMAPAAYHAFLRQGDIHALQRVLTHNARDVAHLPALLAVLLRVYAEPEAFDADVARMAKALRVRRGRGGARGDARMRANPPS
jgi:hypothetical protein